MNKLLQIIIFFFGTISFIYSSEEQCGIEFQRDCEEKETYKLIDQTQAAYLKGDFLVYEQLKELSLERCEKEFKQHISLLCKGYSFMIQLREWENLEETKFIQELKDFILEFQKLETYHTDFLIFYEVLLDEFHSDENDLYDYVKEGILASQPKKANASSEDYLFALARWHEAYVYIIEHFETDEREVLSNYEIALNLYKKTTGQKSEYFLRTKRNLAQYYFLYNDLDISYLTKSYQACQEIILQTELQDSIDSHLHCWRLFDEIEYQKDSGTTQKGFYYRQFVENYLKAIREFQYFNIVMDDDFLGSFPGYFGSLSCFDRRSAWNTYQDLWEKRWEKFTGKGVLDYNREDFESFYADMLISLYALECQEAGLNPELTADLVEDLQEAINESFSTSLDVSDVSELYAIHRAIMTLDPYISVKEVNILKNKLFKRLLGEIDWFEKNNISYQEAYSDNHFQLLFTLVEFLNYEPSENAFLFERINHIKKLFIDYMNNTGMTAEDSVVFDVLTVGIYSKGFEEEAFDNYIELFNLKPLAVSYDLDPFLGDGYNSNTRLAMNSLIIKEDYSKLAYEDFYQNLKYFDRGPLELSVISSKSANSRSKEALDDYLDAERLKSQFINAYSDDLLTEELAVSSQKAVLSSIKKFNGLSEAEKLNLYAYLYPDISLKKIQSKIAVNETVILLYYFFTYTKDFMLSVAIDKDQEVIEVKDITEIGNEYFYDFVNSIEIDMKRSVFTGDKEFLKKIDQLSEIVLPNIELKDKLTFISNLDEWISPSLLRKSGDWLIKSKDIRVNLSLIDYLSDEFSGSKFPSTYIGIGNVDYAGFDAVYEPLPNTESEIKIGSQSFLTKIILLEEKANESNLKKLDLSNAMVHFATHTSRTEDINNQLPSIVMAKSDFNDGYLDVFEISNLDFKNSHIILAACDTDSSIYEDLDVFSGFIKSFQMSGAKSILATRWEIETQSAQRLTQSYINKITKEKNAQKALADVQRELIASETHPFFWSGYFVIE